MFDTTWIDDLDANGAADALAAVRVERMAAEAKQFVLAAHWADLHAGEFVDAVRGGLPRLPGMPRLVPIRGAGSGCVDGCPEIEEYAAAELAALLGRSTVAGEQLVADAVAVRHRHPELWSGIRAGMVPVWVACQVARRCIRAGLDAAQAEWVDAETSRYLATLPPKRFFDLVEAKIIEADPAAAAERARAKALARFVHAGAVDEHGLRTLVARAHAGDVTYLVAVLDRIAVILAQRGDDRPLEVLRAEALRVLGNPARALALLTEATLEHVDPAVEDADELGHHARFPHGDTAGIRDTGGRGLPGKYPVLADLPLLDADELAGLPELQTFEALTGTTLGGGCGCEDGAEAGTEEHADPALLTALLDALKKFDARRLDPVTVLHVHLTDAALTARQGLVRVEGIGPALLTEVRDWLTHPSTPDQIRQQVRLQPVLDATAVRPVDAYEHTKAMSELGTCRTPFEVFPFGTLAARGADNDHPKPYVKDGPPGQTSLEHLAKLSRFHHRLKTNGGWILRQPEPGAYWWRTPHGHWFLVDPDGTHWRGRDPDLDQQYLHQEQAA